MSFNKAFKPAPDVKIMINIGCMFDIPTGRYLTGANGESILNGGLAYTTGIIGAGNMFKSTIMHWQILTALSRMYGSEGGTYDTEMSVHKERLQELADRIPEFDGNNIYDTGRWVITDKTVYSGNKWFDLEKDQLNLKKKDKKQLVRTPFMNYDRSAHFEMLIPTFREVDSLSAFATDADEKIQMENEIGESGGNMGFMRGGIAKTQMIQQLPSVCAGANHYMYLSAHLGRTFNMDPRAPVRKQLQAIPADYKIKGVPEQFTFQMNNAWLCFSTTILKNETTKAPEYPRNSEDDLKGDTDLNLIWVIQTRGKNGPTGMPIGVIVSQTEGVLPSLSEFHYIKNSERYGIQGVNTDTNVNNYFLVMYPEAKLSRTTVRRKIDSDAKLRAALHFTSEMCQMNDLWHHLKGNLLCTPKELYDDLAAKGYDWNVLLNTRPWWGLLDREYELPYLSTMDLLKMRLPVGHPQHYHPYWMEPMVDGKVVSNAMKDTSASLRVIEKAIADSKKKLREFAEDFDGDCESMSNNEILAGVQKRADEKKVNIADQFKRVNSKLKVKENELKELLQEVAEIH